MGRLGLSSPGLPFFSPTLRPTAYRGSAPPGEFSASGLLANFPRWPSTPNVNHPPFGQLRPPAHSRPRPNPSRHLGWTEGGNKQ